MKSNSILIYLIFLGLSCSAQTIDDLSFGTDTTFDIMTWNIQWFPKNGQTTINLCAQIIESLDVDLIAIQEVNDISAFEQMIDGLNSYEGYLESIWFAGLAYVYKPDVIQINDLYEIYTTSPYWGPFPRSPMVIDFDFMNERIIVINNHFKCCGDGILDSTDQDDEERRREYANYLLKSYVDDNFPDENVIILGDLNDELSDESENNVFQLTLDDSENYLFADYEIAIGDNSEWSYPTWPSHLDHILITNELFDEFEDESSTIQTLKIEDYLQGGWQEYDENISDHRPVAMRLLINPGLSISDVTSTVAHFYNYPNPFKTETTFSFKTAIGDQELKIYNLLGQLVYSKKIPNGESSVIWNAERIPHGIYIAKLLLDNNDIHTLKIMIRN
ncbi:hypothetical protein A9Q87_06585 [Flavobacteriales bacterium 34_180_T64]|nr:hypothetical protein A9Q87_06585 [Flavobacteriales bacterium 34_180_T64]